MSVTAAMPSSGRRRGIRSSSCANATARGAQFNMDDSRWTPARSLSVNLALIRAFRRSPMDFLDVLVANGAGTVPLRMGREALPWTTPLRSGSADHGRPAYGGRPRARTRATLLGAPAHQRGRGILPSPCPAAGVPAANRRLPDVLRPRRRTADGWADGGDIDCRGDAELLTPDARGAAPSGLTSASQHRNHACADRSARGFRLAMAPGAPTLLRSRLPVAVRVRSAKAELDNVVEDLIRGRWADGSSPRPVLELLASHPDLTEAQVRDEVMTLLLAGHETTAMALTWALAAIDQRRRARSEPSGRPNRRHVQPVARRTRCP